MNNVLYGYKRQWGETQQTFIARAIVGRWAREGVPCDCRETDPNYPAYSGGSEWHLMGCPASEA